MTQLPSHDADWPTRKGTHTELVRAGAIRRTPSGTWFTRDHQIATWWQVENGGVILQAEGGYERGEKQLPLFDLEDTDLEESA